MEVHRIVGANFEVYIVGHTYLPPDQWETLFSHVGALRLQDTCAVLESWQATKEKTTYIQKKEFIKASVVQGKIVRVQGTAGGHRVGAHQYLEGGLFYTEWWIDTLRLSELDAGIPNEGSSSFCQAVTKALLELSEVSGMEFFAMGTEMMVDYTGHLEQAVRESHHVMCWGDGMGIRFGSCSAEGLE